MKMLTLSEKYIREIGNQEMRPPIYNSSMLVHQSGWHTLKYFSKYYDNKTPYPLLLLMSKAENRLYLPVTKEKELVKEVFRKYWTDPEFLKKRNAEFNKLSEKINQLMDSACTHAHLNENTEAEIIKDLIALEDTTWNMNALVFFSIYFDKKICEEMMSELKIEILADRFEKVWERAIVVPGLSFEKRRYVYLLSLIAQKESWDVIAEKCQYFDTAYDRVSSVEALKERLMKEHSSLTPDQAQKISDEEMANVEIREEENAEWLATLTDVEKKLAHFIQFLIEIRDTRKDFIMKSVTGFYKVAERLFSEAGIASKELIFYTSVDELKKGVQYLKDNTDEIKKRLEGVSLFVHNDNTQELELGPIDENKKIITEHYKNQQAVISDVIKGQPGSRGIVQGVARIILDIEDGKKRLKVGEILVTGMTRPEYVPLMKIAGGIVTDEGGITCHAAIVSRELGKPCVIGTKVATHVLKDGDFVEVDADKGIVRIIK